MKIAVIILEIAAIIDTYDPRIELFIVICQSIVRLREKLLEGYFMRQYFFGFSAGTILVLAIWLFADINSPHRLQTKPLVCANPPPKVVKKVVYEDTPCPERDELSSATEMSQKDGLESSNAQENSFAAKNSSRRIPQRVAPGFIERLNDQPIDPEWALDMEEQLRYELSAFLAARGGTIESLSCRSSMCFLALERKGSTADFVSFSLDTLQALDQIGSVGLDKVVVHHLAPMEGASSYCIAREPGDCLHAIVPNE